MFIKYEPWGSFIPKDVGIISYFDHRNITTNAIIFAKL